MPGAGSLDGTPGWFLSHLNSGACFRASPSIPSTVTGRRPHRPRSRRPRADSGSRTRMQMRSGWSARRTLLLLSPSARIGIPPVDIVTAPDGNIWFTEPVGHSLGMISTTNPAHPIVNYGVAQGLPAIAEPSGLTVGLSQRQFGDLVHGPHPQCARDDLSREPLGDHRSAQYRATR